ncbi:MAG TPA: PQQ-binding-like beta-propeller repeat protein [Lacipirellulaceae bacterium]|jgi:outer membrane protein assembly factor BamB
MKRRFNDHRYEYLRLAAFVAAIGFSAPTYADDWPLVRGDTLGSGVARKPLSDKLDVLWTYHAPGDSGFDATPVVAGGIVYIGDSDGTFDAVRLADGTTVWTKKLGDAGFLAGAAWDQGRLYVGDANGVVRCLSAEDGSEVWRADVGAEVYAGPMIHDQDVLVTCEAGTLACFDAATGKERWHFHIEAPLRCTPTIVAGQALLAGCDSKLHLIDVSSGIEANNVGIDAPTGATPAARDNRVYFGTEGGTFYAIELSAGSDKPPVVAWTYRDPERSQPIRAAAAANEHLVAYGAQGKAVVGLNPANGKPLWTQPTPSRVDSSPVIAGERVVAATDRGVLYLIDAKSGEVKWQFEAGGHFAGSPAVVDGRIVIANADGTLYCFGAKDIDNKKDQINHEDAKDTKKK